MNNETSNLYGNDDSFEANGPSSEARSSDTATQGTESKFKEYGKKSLAPLINLLHKYRSEIDPYFSSISKGLDGAVRAFDASDSEASSDQNQQKADAAVAGWFREASEWFTGAKQKFKSSDAKDLLHFLEDETRKHPGLMFSSSYIAGMAFGRLGRHFGRHVLGGDDSVAQNVSSGEAPYQSSSKEKFGEGLDSLKH